MTDDEFLDFCAQNPNRRIERTAEVMMGTGGMTGSRNSRVISHLGNWADQDGRGEVFDSSSLFRLANTTPRAPEAAWVSYSRLALLTEIQKDKLPPLCPGFVIELMSPSDRLAEVKLKMSEVHGEWL